MHSWQLIVSVQSSCYMFLSPYPRVDRVDTFHTYSNVPQRSSHRHKSSQSVIISHHTQYWLKIRVMRSLVKPTPFQREMRSGHSGWSMSAVVLPFICMYYIIIFEISCSIYQVFSIVYILMIVTHSDRILREEYEKCARVLVHHRATRHTTQNGFVSIVYAYNVNS